MNGLRHLARDKSGGVLVETTLIFPLLLVLSFGLVEFGLAWNQWNMAEKATHSGARWAATRGPVVTGLEDCGVATTQSAGTDCADVAGSDSWTVICNAGAPGANCDGAALTALTAEMQAIYPRITADNVEVRFSGAGLGFVGRGSPVPVVTVRLVNMTFDFIVMDDLLGLGQVTMPEFDASLIGEDLNGAGAPA